MKRNGRKNPYRILIGQRGQALILTLIFLALGSLVLAPLLSYLGTVFQAGGIYKDKTDRLYAADSGIEDAMWQIKYDRLESLFTDPAYDPYDYSTVWTYDLDEDVNGQSATVTIQNLWMARNLAEPDPAEARQIIEASKLVVTGNAPGDATYDIKISFYPEEEEEAEALMVESIGIWLPLGFSYVPNSSNLEEDPFAEYYSVPVVQPYDGGTTVIWNFTSVPLAEFPDVNPLGSPMLTEINFEYTTSDPEVKPAAISWMITSGLADVPYSWDADFGIYHITSQSGETEIEAYTVKCELRKLGSAISGDYRAVGNSLMIDTNHDWWEIRDYLLDESDAEITDIPTDAEVVAAYLYWSGFYDDAVHETIFEDDCSDFDNWDRDSSSGSQTRVPTADGDRNGTWDYSPRWDDVDETTPNDYDSMTGRNSNSYMLFEFSPFTIPSGPPINSLTVYVRAKDIGPGSGKISPYIKVDGTRYRVAPDYNTGGNFQTYSYSYTTNPDTGLPWEADDLNGTGSNPLEQFGVYCDDANPDVQVSMVYAEVNYGNESSWSIYNWAFRGHNGTGPYLTLLNPLDLSAYTGQIVTIGWDQWTYGGLEGSDELLFELSADDGDHWSDPITAFSGPIGPWPQGYSYDIPEQYITDEFLMRFYLSSFNGGDEYCYVDNIYVQSAALEADTDAIFKINDVQVYLDEFGEPQTGAQKIEASQWSILENQPGQYSYACQLDVTDLVQAYSDIGDNENHTGNGEYTVGDVEGDTDEHWSYAGWSIIVIYSSPATAGHQLFLYDTFAWAHEYENLDFDNDGEPGGYINGFIVPEPIDGEVNAATLTCFVAEGDNWVSGDELQFNGTRLSDGSGSDQNVWDSQSAGMSEDGMDIDTFYVTWDSELLEPGDTTAQLDLPTQMDNWNLVYIILSLRSKTSIGGTSHYVVHGK